MNILVTGGSGFVGRRVILRLVADGHRVLALSRSAKAADAVRAIGAEPVTGDLNRPRKLKLPALDGVVHAAAHFRLAGPRRPFFRTNVEGTRALLAASRKAGAKSFVAISAAAVIMDDRGSVLIDADETAPTFPRSFSAYIASKAQAEALVLAANAPGFRTVALRPPAIWGPGDAFSHALPAAVRSGRFSFISRGDYPCVTCHVDNVVEAAAAALSRGTGGRAYSSTTVNRRRFASSPWGSQAHSGSTSPRRGPYLMASPGNSAASWKQCGRSAAPGTTRRFHARWCD